MAGLCDLGPVARSRSTVAGATALPRPPAEEHRADPPAVASKFHLLEGIESFEAGLADPATRARLDEFMSITDAPAPPAVDVRDGRGARPARPGPGPRSTRRPAAATDLPCLVWLHGGAFRMGDLDMPEADWTARQICDRAGAVVVSVDYRLCRRRRDLPGAARRRRRRRPLGARQRRRAGHRRRRISLGGGSAGGNLATGAALRLRDDDGWVPAALLLAYTTFHAVVPPPSAAAGAAAGADPAAAPLPARGPPAASPRTTSAAPESRADGYAMPANAVLDGLCPVLLLNSEYDDLRASAEVFAGQLTAAGVDVRQVRRPAACCTAS